MAEENIQVMGEKPPAVDAGEGTSSQDKDEDEEEWEPLEGDLPMPPPVINPTGNKPKKGANTINTKHLTLPQTSLPPIDENRMKDCEECHREFLRSYLYRTFGVDICDDCRDPKGIHELITRTDAKAKYLLKDCDFDLREPPLRYILKKNPYHSRGDMRLYLKYQVEERAILVHGSEEKLEEELEAREERRVVKKQKVYDKKMKSLSMSVRSSLYKKDLSKHEHEYGEPICLDDDKDLYRKVCKTCGHQWDYEDM